MWPPISLFSTGWLKRGTTRPYFSHNSERCWFRIMQIFPNYRYHFSRLLEIADHLRFARSATGTERLAQGTDGRGPIRRLAGLAGSLPVHRSCPDFPIFPVRERGETMDHDGGV